MAQNTIQLSVVVKDDGTVALQKSVREASTAVDGLGKTAKASSGGLSALASGALAGSLSTAALTAAATATFGAMTAMAAGAVATGEAYFALSQKTGLTVEQISAYSLSAAQADVSSESLALGIKNLNVRLVDAANGGKESAATFKALGVETKNTDGTLRGVNDVFLDTIDGLNQIQNEGERAAAAQAVFGRSSQDLIPLIAEGSDKLREQAIAAAELGLVWSGPAAEAADNLGDQVTVLKVVLRGLSDEVGSYAIPGLTSLVSTTNDVIAKNRELISQGIEAFFRGIGAGADAASAGVSSIARALQSLGDVLDPIIPDLETLQTAVGFLARLPQFQGLTTAAVGLASFSKANADAANEATALAATLDGYTRALRATSAPSDELVAKSNELIDQLKALTEKYPAAARAVEAYRQRVREAQKDTDAASEGNRSFAGALDKTSDAASKAADQLAQLAKGAADSAVALVGQVAAQGDAAATSKAYGDAVAAVVDSYNAQVAAINESTATTEVKEKQKAAAASDASTKIQQAAQGVVDAEKKQIQAIAQLDAAISQSQLALLADDIQQITDDWNELSTTQRESELPAVLEKLDQKYKLLIDSATAAAAAQKAQGVTAEEAERIDANLALTTQHLNNQLADEKQAWADAASGAKTYVTFARAVEDELDKLSGDLSNLAASLLTGQTGWDDAGKAVAGMFLRGFQDILATQLQPLINGVLNNALSIAADVAGSILSSILPGVLGSSVSSAATSGVATAGGIAAGSSLAGAVGTGFSTIGSAGLTAVIGETGAAVVGAGLGAAAVGAAIVAGVAGIGLGIAAAFGAFEGPDMQKRISRHLAKMIENAFGDPSVTQAVDAALEALGFDLTAGIQRTITQTPISGAEVRAVWAEGGAVAGQSYTDGFYKFLASEGNGINNLAASDLINLYFPGLDEAGEAAANEAAKMAGAAAASMQGLTGPDALVFTEQFAAGLVNVAHTLGLTDEEFLKFVNDVAGPGAAQFAAALDQLNGAAVASLGPAGFQGLLEDVSKHMERVFGVKNIDATNLLDVFIQSGASAEAFAAQLERLADSDPALRRLVDSMDPPLIDALHDAETATQELAQAFGVLSGASNANLAAVVEDFQRFAGQIRDSEGELTSMGKVLVEQTRSAVAGMQSAILEDSQVTLDEAAKVFEQLALIPAEALSDPSVKAAYDEIIANLLAGTDTASIDELKAKIAAMPPVEPPVNPETADQAKAATDDLAASVGVLGEQAAQLSEGPSVTESLGLTPEAAAAMTGVTDNLTTAVAATDDLAASVGVLGEQASKLSEGQSVTESLGLTPEAAAAMTGVTDNLTTAVVATDGLTSSMGDLAASVTSSTDGFATLAQQSGLTSEQVQAALQPIIGTPDDGQSLSAMNDVIGRVIPESLNATTDNVLGSTGTWHDSFDYARGGVIMLHDELTGLAGNYDVTVTTTYLTVGTPPSPGGTPPPPDPGPPGATGGWIPGAVGEPFPMVAHGGEFLIPAEIARRVVGGGTAPYVAPSAGVGPSVDSVAAAVERRLTQGGRLHVLQVSEAQYQRLSRSILLTDLPAQVAGGSLSIPGFRRNPGAPG